MKIPDVDIPITSVRFPWEIVAQAERAAERVWERMYKAAAALTGAHIPFVAIGGNAVGIWVATKDEGAVRNTRFERTRTGSHPARGDSGLVSCTRLRNLGVG